MPDADLAAGRSEAEDQAQRPITDAEFASWLMYPQVFADYAARQRDYGDVSVLPTPVYFYGMEPRRGDRLRHRARAHPDRPLSRAQRNRPEGRMHRLLRAERTTRTVRVADRNAAVEGMALPKAEEGNAGHVGAPMPGMVVKVFFGAGEAVEEGDVLVAIEAMKMETVIRAERGGVVAEIVAPAGTTVDTKDLLVVLGD